VKNALHFRAEGMSWKTEVQAWKNPRDTTMGICCEVEVWGGECTYLFLNGHCWKQKHKKLWRHFSVLIFKIYFVFFLPYLPSAPYAHPSDLDIP
jgi:hypothetical protein